MARVAWGRTSAETREVERCEAEGSRSGEHPNHIFAILFRSPTRARHAALSAVALPVLYDAPVIGVRAPAPAPAHRRRPTCPDVAPDLGDHLELALGDDGLQRARQRRAAAGKKTQNIQIYATRERERISVRRKRKIAERTSRPSTKYAPQSTVYAISPSAALDNTYSPTRPPSPAEPPKQKRKKGKGGEGVCAKKKQKQDMRQKRRDECTGQAPPSIKAGSSVLAKLSSSYPALFTPVPLGFAFAAFDENLLLPPPTPACRGGGRRMRGRDEDAGLPAHERTHLPCVICVHPRLEVGPEEGARFELGKEECEAVGEEEGKGKIPPSLLSVVETRPWRLEGETWKNRDKTRAKLDTRQRQGIRWPSVKAKGEYIRWRRRGCVVSARDGAEESREESRGWDRRDETGLASHPVFGTLSSSSIFQPQPDSEFILGWVLVPNPLSLKFDFLISLLRQFPVCAHRSGPQAS
ncbi:hypothetical protein B0H14DRAFT_3746956 [Mycena olivaceomarginata]|nr:hypothetical protein B0H14DRAFT_3746956 [Mycena olivaceomarginata]